jgi:hypothetical protein
MDVVGFGGHTETSRLLVNARAIESVDSDRITALRWADFDECYVMSILALGIKGKTLFD